MIMSFQEDSFEITNLVISQNKITPKLRYSKFLLGLKQKNLPNPSNHKS